MFSEKLKRTAIIGLMAAGFGMGLASQASADPLLLGTYNGPVAMQYFGYSSTSESVATGSNPGVYGDEQTFGAGYMSSVIGTSPPTPLYSLNVDNPIGFFIYGIADGQITGSAPNLQIFNVGATGGAFADGAIHIDFYDLTGSGIPDFNNLDAAGMQASDRTGFSTFNGITNAGPLLMSWEFVPGILQVDDLATAGFDETTTVLLQDVSSATLPATGDGDGYAKCVAGPACANFDTDGFPLINPDADFFIQFSLALNLSANELANGWQGRIADPVQTFMVPEPGTLAILGFGLAGLGLMRRRRRMAA